MNDKAAHIHGDLGRGKVQEAGGPIGGLISTLSVEGLHPSTFELFNQSHFTSNGSEAKGKLNKKWWTCQS